MVRFLFGNVVPDQRHRRRAHGEGGVSLLPREPRIADRIGGVLGVIQGASPLLWGAMFVVAVLLALFGK